MNDQTLTLLPFCVITICVEVLAMGLFRNWLRGSCKMAGFPGLIPQQKVDDKAMKKTLSYTHPIYTSYHVTSLMHQGVDKQNVAELAGHGDTGFLERTYCHPQMEYKQTADRLMLSDLLPNASA